MSPKQAIILGYGFTGRAIDRAFNSRGYETFGVRRDWSDSGDENLHSEPLEADVTDPESLQDLPEDADVLPPGVFDPGPCALDGTRREVHTDHAPRPADPVAEIRKVRARSRPHVENGVAGREGERIDGPLAPAADRWQRCDPVVDGGPPAVEVVDCRRGSTGVMGVGWTA